MYGNLILAPINYRNFIEYYYDHELAVNWPRIGLCAIKNIVTTRILLGIIPDHPTWDH